MQPGWRKFALIAAFGLTIAGVLAAHAAGLIGSATVEEAPGARRERAVSDTVNTVNTADPQAPAISFIDNPAATCYQSVTAENTCYISWNYLYVSASDAQYVISMSISIDNRLRAYNAGFFQTSMYIPGDMFGPGFQVACGRRGANNLGNTYAYTVRARETGGLSSANYGSVTCPGVAIAHLPVIRR